MLQQWLKNNLLKEDGPSNLCKSTSLEHKEFLKNVQTFLRENSENKLNDQQFTSLTGIFYLLFGILHSLDNFKAFNVKIETDLCVGAGTGSSASFAVAVAASFVYFKHLKLFRTKLTEFSDIEKDLICKWAFCIEKISHGLPSGIDNTICTYGSVMKFRKSEGMQFISTCEFKLLLINTMVARSTKAILDKVMVLKGHHTTIMNLVFDTMHLIADSAVNCIIEIGSDTNNAILYRRLGELTHMNQCMLQALGASHPAIDEICTVLGKAGVCGKLTGAGGGGYVIAIIPPYISESELNNLIVQLTSKGFEANMTKLGGVGVSIV